MKFGILTLAFYGSSTLDRMLKNTGGLVDKIYLSHSPVPWSKYNKDARTQYISEFDKESLNNLPYSEKITFIEGVWESDEAQREHALQIARKEGMDYLIIQDADEFYLPEEFKKNIEGIKSNPNHPVYTCPWVKFWKNTRYIMEARVHEGKKNQVVSSCPNFAVNVNWPGIYFNLSRLVNEMDQAFKLDGLCLHLCWVLTDEQVLKKISTWGHSHQFDFRNWYKHKWLAWKPDTEYIGVFSRANYNRAVPNTFELPVEIIDLPDPEQSYVPLSTFEKIKSDYFDLKSIIKAKILELRHLRN